VKADVNLGSVGMGEARLRFSFFVCLFTLNKRLPLSAFGEAIYNVIIVS
jgi:hypothetical protein